jgi:diguanylate cyclase (GGDEF)-like protein
MTILLLEDDIALNKAIRKVLELDHHVVTAFTDGKEMLDALTQVYDLYILDINVPHISGMELLDIVMHQNLEARVMMISVNTDIHSLETAYSLGCVDYLKKPFHIAELRAKVGRIARSKPYDIASIALTNEDTVLTKKEKRLLELLLDNLSRVVSYEVIERYVYEGKAMSMHAIRALVLRLRSKLAEDIIKNVVDEGYMITQLPAVTEDIASDRTKARLLALKQENLQLREEKASLLKRSTTDPLTGLYNRVKIEEVYAFERRHFVEYGDPLSVIMMDLDDFKEVNDRYGHNVGDTYLTLLSETLKSFFRKGDYVGRWGGEEFIVLLLRTSLADAKKTALRLQKAINAIDFPKLGRRSASYGVTTLREGDSFITLIERADKALLKAKADGKDRVEVDTALD